MRYPKIDHVYSGTSGLVVPERNKQSFPAAYRDKSRLTYYASLFNSIEINSSFKKVPMIRTVTKWAAEVPDNFQFTFKCPQTITHNKDLLFDPEHIRNFLEVISHVGNKRGCLLVQFPGKLGIAYKEKLEEILGTLQEYDPKNQWKIALEFRNESWYHDEILDLLHKYGVSLVLHDLRPAAPPVMDKAAFVYIRFHGPERGYRGSYSADFLRVYAARINAWIKEGKVVYVYFNNTMGDAATNLKSLNDFITRNNKHDFAR